MKLQDYTATEKDEISLDCELSKDVPVVWYHNEKEVISSKMVVLRSEGTRRALVLKRVEQSHRGTYVCDCGSDKTSASISIEGSKELLAKQVRGHCHLLMFHLGFSFLNLPARDIKVVRPIYGVELFDGETARFEVEISEDDVHGQWKLNGDILSPSAVRTSLLFFLLCLVEWKFPSLTETLTCRMLTSSRREPNTL